MKISLAWLFDHIDADWQTQDVPALIAKINESVAEIERHYPIKSESSLFFIVTPQATGQLFCTELQKKLELPARKDLIADQCYLVIKEQGGYRWATSCDLGAHKEMILPAISLPEAQVAGGWRQAFENKDYIFEVDNKSVTHRPDLWGHRGFAQEIAALLNLPLKPITEFCTNLAIQSHEQEAPSSTQMPFMLAIEDTKEVKRLAGLYLPKVAPSASLLWMATRLSRVDSRSIDAIVDSTNYVMLDTSQPMHAFNSEKLTHKKIIARMARNKESLTLLDDQMIELSAQDIIIADGDQPISLAGIMGGKQTAVGADSKSLFLESANFDPTTIRLSSAWHKVRSEASARFEKSLDPNQNILALERFLFLLQQAGIAQDVKQPIISLGKEIKPLTVQVPHKFIEDRLGCSIASDFIISRLQKLGFKVAQEKPDNQLLYTITIPTYRATKDVHLREDIVEEIGRFYGYSNIPASMPSMQTKPSPVHAIAQKYRIKQLMAFGLAMRELYTYAFFDESFLKELDWDPGKTIQVKDPVSQNWYRLVTTLMPNMFKAVHQNFNEHDQLNFFEWGRRWQEGQKIEEHKVLAGIFYKKHEKLNFYQGKAELTKLFEQLGLKVGWHAPQKLPYPWFDEQQVAYIEHNGTNLGVAGMVGKKFAKKFTLGSLFVFELNADYFESYQKPITRFESISKYQPVERDVSLMVPMALTVAEISKIVCATSTLITSVRLVDMFQDKGWDDKRALTFRYVMQSHDGTLSKDAVDEISAKIATELEAAGAQVR